MALCGNTAVPIIITTHPNKQDKITATPAGAGIHFNVRFTGYFPGFLCSTFLR